MDDTLAAAPCPPGQSLPAVVQDAPPVPGWLPPSALAFELGAALLGVVVVCMGRRRLVPIVVALWASVACEGIRYLLAARLDVAFVPYRGTDRTADALDLLATIAGFCVDLIAVALVLRRFPKSPRWTRPAAHAIACVAFVFWGALAFGYPAAWARGAGRAHWIAGAHLFAFGVASFVAVEWLRANVRLRIEHASALAVYLAHFGLVLGPWSPLSGSAAYASHRPWAIVLFGLAWIAVVCMEASWIRRRFLSRSSPRL